MITDLCIVHRRKPNVFGPEEAVGPLWATCLRGLLFVTKEQGERLAQAHDECYVGLDAYKFLLEVVCGLHSPIVGETEVFGQFKLFIEEWLFKQPQHAALAQRILSDAKALRSEYLGNLGNQSYGSWLRKNLRENTIHILGGGHLVREILPYLTKQGKNVTLHVRCPEKIDFFDGKIRRISDNAFDQGALIVAAPLTSLDIETWLGGRQAVQIFDLRDNSSSDKIQSAFDSVGLKDIFHQIEQNKARLVPLVEKVRAEIELRALKLSAAAIVRPQGWDDICA
jgi:glutamyl-tRNA reductase